MPSSRQNWSHATNSSGKLQDALADPDVTAIEADLLMGRHHDESSAHHGQSQNNNRKKEEEEEEVVAVVPIMSHPPEFVSDLSAETFLRQVISTKELCPRSGKRRLEKHIKLDFKDLDVVEPTLKMFKEFDVSVEDRTLFLNADVIPGPGKSTDDVQVHADHFIETCMKIMSEESVRC